MPGGGALKRTATLIAATLAALTFPIQAAIANCHVAQFVPGQYEIKENEGTVTIGVQNPGSAAEERSVDWETVNGSAKAGSDFVAGSGTLSFTPRDRSKVIEVAIIDNNKHESREAFTVRLIARPGSCISQDYIGPPASVSITDDDPKLVVPAPSPTKSNAASPAHPPNESSASPSPAQPSTASAAPSPSSSTSPSPSPSPSPTLSAIAASDQGSDGGLSGGALAGIIAGVVVVGGSAALLVRRRFLS